MKKPSITLGYITVFFVALYAVFKFGLLPGANGIMIIAGIFIAIYFPKLFLNQVHKRFEKRPMFVYKFGALLLSIIILTVVFRFNHWSLAGFKGGQIIRLFSIPSWIYIIPYCCVSFIFIPWVIYTNHLHNKKHLLKNIVGGIGLALIPISLIGWDFHFSFRRELFTLGNILIILIYLPMHIRMAKKEKKELDFTFNILVIAYILLLFVYGVYFKWDVTYEDVIMRLK